LQPHFLPGTAAYYSDTNFDLLGKIIEAIAGQPLHSVYQDIIFRPLGLTHTWLIESSAPQTLIPTSPADVFYRDRNITDMRSNSVYCPYMISTAEEMTIFLKALNEGRIISKDSLELMHNWHKLRFPFRYGYGTMYFRLPPLATKLTNMRPLWGHSGSTGSFLYYSSELNLYMAGTIDQVEWPSKPFRLMASVMKVVKSRS
jgi:CubicO group peptidase (beta-lactamase class C family)